MDKWKDGKMERWKDGTESGKQTEVSERCVWVSIVPSTQLSCSLCYRYVSYMPCYYEWSCSLCYRCSSLLPTASLHCPLASHPCPTPTAQVLSLIFFCHHGLPFIPLLLCFYFFRVSEFALGFSHNWLVGKSPVTLLTFPLLYKPLVDQSLPSWRSRYPF